jgi:Flp pilus assembly protein TadB
MTVHLGRAPVRRRSEQARRRQALAQLPDLVELMVIAIRSGSTPVAAFEAIADYAPPALRPTVDDVRHRLARGARFADAIDAIGDDLGPAGSALIDSLATADRYGLAIAPVLDRLSDEIRSERRRAGELRARTLPVKLAFPLVTCTLPSFVLVAIVPALLGAIASLSESSP